jgi:hypothetical protein
MLTAAQQAAAEREADKIELESLARTLADDFNQRPTNWENWSRSEKRPFFSLARTAKEFLQHSRP